MGCDKCQMEICFCPETKDGIRWKLIQHIKQQIQAGTYLTDKKLAMALENFLKSQGH